MAVMGWRLHHPSLLSAFTTVLIAWSAVGKPNGVCEGREGRQGMLGAATTTGAQTTDNNQLKAAAEESALSPLHNDGGDDDGDNDDDGSGDDSGGTKSGSGRIGAVTVA